MNKRIYDYNERGGDVRYKKRQKNNGKEDDSDRNESKGTIHNEMNTHSKRKMRRYKVKGRKKKENVWDESNNEVEKSERRNGEWG